MKFRSRGQKGPAHSNLTLFAPPFPLTSSTAAADKKAQTHKNLMEWLSTSPLEAGEEIPPLEVLQADPPEILKRHLPPPQPPMRSLDTTSAPLEGLGLQGDAPLRASAPGAPASTVGSPRAGMRKSSILVAALARLRSRWKQGTAQGGAAGDEMLGSAEAVDAAGLQAQQQQAGGGAVIWHDLLHPHPPHSPGGTGQGQQYQQQQQHLDALSVKSLPARMRFHSSSGQEHLPVDGAGEAVLRSSRSVVSAEAPRDLSPGGGRAPLYGILQQGYASMGGGSSSAGVAAAARARARREIAFRRPKNVAAWFADAPPGVSGMWSQAASEWDAPAPNPMPPITCLPVCGPPRVPPEAPTSPRPLSSLGRTASLPSFPGPAQSGTEGLGQHEVWCSAPDAVSGSPTLKHLSEPAMLLSGRGSTGGLPNRTPAPRPPPRLSDLGTSTPSDRHSAPHLVPHPPPPPAESPSLPALSSPQQQLTRQLTRQMSTSKRVWQNPNALLPSLSGSGRASFKIGNSSSARWSSLRAAAAAAAVAAVGSGGLQSEPVAEEEEAQGDRQGEEQQRGGQSQAQAQLPAQEAPLLGRRTLSLAASGQAGGGAGPGGPRSPLGRSPLGGPASSPGGVRAAGEAQ